MVIGGTRPEFIKLASLISNLQEIPQVDLIFIHSGQHFDEAMSDRIIEELGLPDPVQNFDVGNRSDVQQIAKTLRECESAIRNYEPDIVLAEGDTNTVAAVAMTAKKIGTPFAHVEAGLRSFDRSMPEEVNRVIADACSELCFCPTEISAVNLCGEGVLPNRIRITGNTIVDACQKYLPKAFTKSNILREIGLSDRFGLVTIHRRENVDNPEKLSRIIDALCGLDEIDLVFPIHPRTQKRLAKSVSWQRTSTAPNLILSSPLGYLDFLRLLASSTLVLTDSGGVQEEALTLRVPCLTLRENTERPETVIAGGNRLVGTEPQLVKSSAREILSDRERAVAGIARENPLGDGKAGARIAKLCVDYCENTYSTVTVSTPQLVAPIFLTVGTMEQGITVTEFSDRVGGLVTMIYDKTGSPMFPNPDLCLENGWSVCLLGHKPDHHNTRQITKNISTIPSRQ